jgi:hypothetical protein
MPRKKKRNVTAPGNAEMARYLAAADPKKHESERKEQSKK